MKVEIFHSVDSVKLQTQINEFFKNHPNINFIDLKFQQVQGSSGDSLYTAMIIYK